MQLSVKAFARLTGVSVRTLHYYDEIGLLKPGLVDPENGYRYYDSTNLERMQAILFYRELDFPLKSIREILASPHYDKAAAMAKQKQLLTLKKERLERLIAALEKAEQGEMIVNAFDNKDYETVRAQYEAEAKARWGDTAAYQEYEQKGGAADAAEGLMAVFGEFAACQAAGNASDGEAAQTVVGRLQDYITAHFYTCTKEILAGLGQMYVADQRFRENIDRYGEGTAAFAAEAIESYCK